MERKQEDNSQIAWIILNAVKNMQVGVDKMSLFLKGSKSKLVVPIESQQLFGGLMWHDIPTIKGFVRQLLNMELIRQRIVDYGYYRFPILELTEAGKKVLDGKIKVGLQIIKEKKPIRAGESEEKTLEMFNAGKNADEIAKERDLAVSTIYTHFFRLIANKHLSAEDVVSEDVIKVVAEVYAQFRNEPKLKELKEKLPENISYEEIKCVVAGIKKESNENRGDKHV